MWAFTPSSLPSSGLTLPWSVRTMLHLELLSRPALHFILVSTICSVRFFFWGAWPHISIWHINLSCNTNFFTRFNLSIKNNYLIPSLASNSPHSYSSTLTVSWFQFILQWVKSSFIVQVQIYKTIAISMYFPLLSTYNTKGSALYHGLLCFAWFAICLSQFPFTDTLLNILSTVASVYNVQPYCLCLTLFSL